MNKKSIFSTIKIIALGILLSAGLSYAQTPAGNVSKPIHVNSLQTKTGTLGIGPLVVNGISQFYNTVNILGLNVSAPTGVPFGPADPTPPSSGGGGGPTTFLDKFIPKALAGANEICGNGIDDNNNLLIDEGCSSAGYFQVELNVYQVNHPTPPATTYCDPATQNCATGSTLGINSGDTITLKWNVTPVGSIALSYCTKQMNTLSPVSPLGWTGNTSSSLNGSQTLSPTVVGVMHQFVLNCYDTGGVWAGLAFTNVYIKNQGDLNVTGKMGVGTAGLLATLDINGNIRIGNTFGQGANPGVCATNTGHLLSC